MVTDGDKSVSKNCPIRGTRKHAGYRMVTKGLCFVLNSKVHRRFDCNEEKRAER